MKKSSKSRLMMNIGLIALIVFLIVFFVRHALKDIFEELKSTSLVVLLLVIILGVCYQLVEGQAIRLIAKPFAKDFTQKDGFFTSCYIAFYRVVTLGTGTFLSEIQFYRNKGMKTYQSVGTSFLHMIMYKLAIITYAVVGLIIQFSLVYEKSSNMILVILLGLGLNVLIVAVLLVLSSSLYLQIGLVVICNKVFKNQKIRDYIDQYNLQIYSLRDAVKGVLEDRTALFRIYCWNLIKLFFWYMIPFVVLVQEYPSVDFLQTIAFISFSILLAGVIPTPAGMGSLEFVYVMLFKRLVGTVDAASSVLLYRFGTYVLPFLIGFVYVFITKRREIKEEIIEVKKEKTSEE